MPTMSEEQAAHTPEWLAVREACQMQGRKLYWIAGEAGMSYRTFHAKMHRDAGYTWRQGERERIAAALGKAVADIWPDEAA